MRRFLLLALLAFALGLPFVGGKGAVGFLLEDLGLAAANGFRPAAEASDRVAVVLMDRPSEARLGLPVGSAWRRFHPDFIRTLVEAGALIVVFDAEFLASEPALDPALAAACAAAGIVVAGEADAGSTTPALADSFAAFGSLMVGSYAGVPRRVSGGGGVPALSVAAAALAWERGGVVPDAASSKALEEGFWIDYGRRTAFFPAFSYADVLLAAEGRLADAARTPLSVFSGKIVLVGDGTGQDVYPLPPLLGARAPGVLGQAYALETLLGGRPPRRAPFPLDAAFLALFAAAAALAARPGRLLPRLALLLPLLVLAFALGSLLQPLAGLRVSALPALVAVLAVLVADLAERRIVLQRSLRRAMGFDPALIEAFRRERAKGGAVRHEVAVLIADIRDFTAFVARTDRVRVSSVLGDYMGAMEACVGKRGGYVNKFVGDEVVAVFGFPLAGEAAAGRAVGAALDMVAGLERLVASWDADGLPAISEIGIGIDMGIADFVEIGGRDRSQFDVVGDCINGASRIEAMTKLHGRPLLVSGEVWAALPQADRDRFEGFGPTELRGLGSREIYGLRSTNAGTDVEQG